MGILSSIVGSVKKSFVGKALDTLSAAFIKPVETVEAIFSPTKTINDVIKKVDSQSLTKNITSTLVNTAMAATAVVGVGAGIKAAQAGTLLPALIPSTTKGKIIAAVAAPIVVGAVVNQPTKTASAILNTPEALGNVGGNVANLIAEPSIENLKTLVKENPVIVSGAAIAGVTAVGIGATGVISNVLNTAAVKENTKIMQEGLSSPSGSSLPTTKPEPQNQTKAVIPENQMAPTFYPANNQPTLPQTKVVSSTTTRKRRKSIKKPTQFINNNRVNVLISNHGNTTKRYIKQPLYN